MKIGMILEDYYPEDIRVTKEAEALVNAGFEVYLLCMKKDREESLEIIDNIKVVRASLPVKQTVKGIFYRAINAFTFNHPLWKTKIEKFVKDYDIDILHVHDLPLFGTSNKVAKKLNKKIIVDFHENYPDGLQVWGMWKTDFKNKYIYPILSNYNRWLRFEKIACEECDRAIVVVSHMQKRLSNLHDLDKDKTFVVSNTENLAFEDMKIYEDIETKYKDKFIISYIGGVGFHRGIDTTIKAFNQIDADDIYLLIVGGIDKSIKKYLESISTNQNIIYTGQVPFDKVASYIKASDVCLVPHNNTEHTNNTIPHKLFQYMLLKKPVIVSSCPPLKEVVEECDCGLVFKSDDYDDLRDKIKDIYDLKDLEYLGKNGYNYAKLKYHFEEDAKVLINMYKELSNA
jgi:glycosyltransferase involved in cell wall biosynthesis